MRNYIPEYSGFFTLFHDEFCKLEMKLPYDEIINKDQVFHWARSKGIKPSRFCIRKLPETHRTYPSDRAALLVFELEDGSLVAKRYLANGYLNVRRK